MKKIIKLLGVGILLLLISSTIYVLLSVPKLPYNCDVKIDGVLNSELPEIIKGETGYISNSDLNIWYYNDGAKKE
jgi:hypothetical protein